MMPTLKELYRSKIVPEMMKQFKYKSVMQVPKLVKISLNVGMGKAAELTRKHLPGYDKKVRPLLFGSQLWRKASYKSCRRYREAP